MFVTLSSVYYVLQTVLQRLSFALIACSAVALVTVTTLSAVGYLPWMTLPIGFGEETYDAAGTYVQIGLTAFTVMLAFYLPTNARMMALETSHRSFSIGMQDVAHAYHMAHAADRLNTFRLSSEFDAVRERLSHLRTHPDLSDLEPAVLEIAAQMSHVSRELAEVYSDEKVERARVFLKQRQQEVERFNERLTQAKGISQEIKHWLHEVELEEAVAASQLQRLRGELHDVLPEMGLETFAKPEKIVGLSRAAE